MTNRPIAIAAVLCALLAAAGPGAARQTAPRIIEITAERFEFWPSEINVAVGEAVELRIRSDDTTHGFRILGQGTNVAIPKRGKGYVSVKLTPTEAGRFTFECSRMCGAGHNFMRGVLVVKAPADGGK